MRNATHTIRAKRSRPWRRCPTGSSCAKLAGVSRSTRCATSIVHLEQLERSVTAAGGVVHWAPEAAERKPHRRRSDRRGRRARGRQGQVARDRRDRAQSRRSRARGITRDETDLAELIVQLGDDRPSHILVPAIHRNRGEIRELFRRDAARQRASSPTIRRRSRRPRGGSCARSSCSAKVGVSGANFAVAETGHGLRRRVRGQRAHVHDPAGGPDHGDGDREGAAPLRRPRSDAAAPPPLLDRRADEPVHLAVDRRHARGRPAGVPSRPARRRSHERPCATPTGAPRCTASAARPA